MALAMQLVFFLYLLASVGASDVFRLVYSSVQLDLQKKISNVGIFTWSFNKSTGILQHILGSSSILLPKYKDKVENNMESHSLTLNDLQKNDSGLYKADIFDPVKKPALTVSHQPSNGTCYTTITCKTLYLSITQNCYSDPCDNKTEKESGNTLLSLYVRDGFIVCNHSNPVSWETTDEVKQLCLPEGDKELPPGPFSYKLVAIPVAIGGLIIGIIVYFLYKKYCRTTAENTAYEDVKGGNKAQTIYMSKKHESPGTVYCTVEKPTQACSNDEGTVSTANPDKNQGTEHVYTALEFITPQAIYHTVEKNVKIV